MPSALITGITGQDGSYLAELLLSKGYEVHGLIRRLSTSNHWRIEHIKDRINLIYGDILDEISLIRAMKISMPDECYHLAAQSQVGISFTQPIFTAECTGIGTLKMLEAIRNVKPDTRFYNAASSELFGKVQESPQTELTPFYPRSPYGVAKLYGYWITKNYREAYGMFACSGLLFNHESPRRPPQFVTRKITQAVARIKLGLKKELRLGNLDAKRDWSHASDMVRGMYLMLQQDNPDDYVLASGEAHSVREFCDRAFGTVGLDYKNYVVVDPKFYRPADVELLIGDPSKAREELGWVPKINFDNLIIRMVNNDLKIERSKINQV